MVDALALGASSARNGGSSPLPGTISTFVLKKMTIPSIIFLGLFVYINIWVKSQAELVSKWKQFFEGRNALSKETAISLTSDELASLKISESLYINESPIEYIHKLKSNKYYFNLGTSKNFNNLKIIFLLVFVLTEVFALISYINLSRGN